ncbi:MAG: globin domain-containing protein [Rhodococcus sp. (in: high G+C Gram-positive bacteria)]
MLDTGALAHVRTGVGAVLSTEDGPDAVAGAFYARLFAEYPDFRAYFPPAMDQQRHRLVRAIDYVVAHLDDQQFMPFLHQLGRDHRKHGLSGAHFLAAQNALIGAFRAAASPADWTPDTDDAWTRVVSMICNTMAVGADTEDLPPYWGATVVEHERVLADVAVVRLESDHDIPFAAGQYLSVQIPQRPRMWRYLSPAIAPNDYRGIEFHVRRVSAGWVSPAMVSETVVGDRWLLGPPLGGLSLDTSPGCEDVLMIAGGTGIAPLRAQLMDMAMRSSNPRVHLFVGGEYPSDLYDIDTLWNISRTNPWLTVVPVVEHPEEPWWRPGPAREFPPGMNHTMVGKLGQVVTRFGSWADRQIQVCGSPSMVRTTLYALRRVGTPMQNVQHDPLA